MRAPLCIYHGNCPDGLMSAAVFLIAFPEGETFAAISRTTLPDVSLLSDRDVYLVDFSYSLENILLLKSQCSNLVILDHHDTAKAVLSKLPYAVFQDNKSGCQIAWDFFFPGQLVPKAVELIGNADLWNFSVDGTQQISIVAEALPSDPKAWKDFLYTVEQDYSSVLAQGTFLLPWKESLLQRLAAKSFMVEFEGFVVPAINSSIWKSELGGILSVGHPFAIIFSGYGSSWSWSLRSQKTGENCRLIAEKYKGGGHNNAASFFHTIAPEKIK